MGRLRRLVLWVVGGLLLTGATLTCCVLPTLLVLVGAGSVVASLIQLVPGLVAVSEHSWVVFVLAGTLLTINSVQLRRSRHAPCPADAVLAERCRRARIWARRIHTTALVVYGSSLIVTFVVPRLLLNH